MKLFSYKIKARDVIEQIILENYNSYYRLAMSYVHNEADAADIVQNGAYRAIRKAESIRNIEYAKTWVYRIMLNEIFRQLKQNSPVSLEEGIITEPSVQFTEGVSESLDLKKALDELSAKDKAVIELRYFEDCKLEEIAEILEENISTVKSRLYRSIQKLRLQLKDDDLAE